MNTMGLRRIIQQEEEVLKKSLFHQDQFPNLRFCAAATSCLAYILRALRVLCGESL